MKLIFLFSRGENPMQTFSKSILALILTFGIVQPVSASALDGTDHVIREPVGGQELLEMLNSPNANIRLTGAYYVFGVLEGHVVTDSPNLDVCILEKAVTVDDLVTTVRNYYASYPFLLKDKTKLAPADIINAFQKRYPCKKK